MKNSFLRTIGLISAGYMANDIAKNGFPVRRSYSGYRPKYYDEYSIKRTLKKIACHKLEDLFEGGHGEPHIMRGYGLFNNIIFPSRRKAEKVLEELNMLIDKYGKATVADFYDLSEMPSTYNDSHKFWKNLGTARVIHKRRGFLILLPTPLED